MRALSFQNVPLWLSALLVTPAEAFFRMPCPSRLVQERADPIVNPGAVAAHVHTISGGNGFSFDMDYEDARASQCSSCPIKQDLSNYWTPTLYYQAENRSFISVAQAGDGDGTTGGMTVYYLQRPGPNNDKLHAFPKGFRMLAGDPMKRNNTNDFESEAVSYVCLNYNGPAKPETNAFPNYNCPDGLRVQLFFPSCWDGKNLDSPDHRSHMAYPISGAYNNGACPKSHPVHMVSLFYEVIWQTNKFADQWYGDKQPFVFAHGDPTGYGMHADFVNGWDVDVLQKAVDVCLNDSGRIEDCLTPEGDSVFEFFTGEECQACSLPSYVDEQIHGVLDKLPGCNPVTYGPERAEHVSCAKTPIGQAAPYFTDLIEKNWEYVGCGIDKYDNRTFTAESTRDDKMTVERCTEFCSSKGYDYAGLEYSSECYCDNSIPADRRPKKGIMGNCQMSCSGDNSQYCGSGGSMSIYHKCSGEAKCENNEVGSPGKLKNSAEEARVKQHLRRHADRNSHRFSI
ncbi:DUF1996 and WSC domain-containing protein [Aspergillus affinis]|uniref:DUF1996 and WSC domain-containing protein n=1 Tax=Aspergillus affinis TaxID=1070780 RepID=UPI0022FDBB84|nr:uncharacterized protein KD926_005923 [Aspergillus affinis]KAI9045978.1 hypothetical protein KD926_005923 [Aspergillus affinis]